MIHSNLIILIFSLLLILVMPFFCVFVQTIKNLIAFAVLVFLVAINLMLFFSIEFLPIFFMLIYVGAIIVTTLFMVLTFDLRAEYSSKKTFEPKALKNVFFYFIFSSLLAIFLSFFERMLWKRGTADELDRIEIYRACIRRPGVDRKFCNLHFGETGMSRGLYQSIGESVNDVAVISNNLYTTYSLLFVLLGVILTIALIAALTLLKGK